MALVCFNLICIGLLWASSYIDEINMINNGYKDKSSITFRVDNVTKLAPTRHKYILFQYDPEMPKIKHIVLNREIKLPPITKIIDYDINDLNQNFAIIGTEAELNDVPEGYRIIGYFNTPNSYLLNSEVWLISRNFDINHGREFTINAPNHDEKSIINQVFKDSQYNMINTEQRGSYLLFSNRLLSLVIQLCIVLTFIILVMISIVRISREKYMIRVMHLYGCTVGTIFRIVFSYILIPYLMLSALIIIMSLLFQTYIHPLWSWVWISQSIYIFGSITFCILIIITMQIVTTISQKGGKRF